MWSDVGTFVIGALGVAAAANWLSSGSARRLSELKAHAEVLALLPPGRAKARFTVRVERLAWMHAEIGTRADLTMWSAARKLSRWAFLIVWLTSAVLIVWGEQVESTPSWYWLVVWALAAALGLLLAFVVESGRRAGEASERSLERWIADPTDESAD